MHALYFFPHLHKIKVFFKGVCMLGRSLCVSVLSACLCVGVTSDSVGPHPKKDVVSIVWWLAINHVAIYRWIFFPHRTAHNFCLSFYTCLKYVYLWAFKDTTMEKLHDIRTYYIPKSPSTLLDVIT